MGLGKDGAGDQGTGWRYIVYERMESVQASGVWSVDLLASLAMSDKRSIRLRREYLYRKSIESRRKSTYEQKEALRKTIEGCV